MVKVTPEERGVFWKRRKAGEHLGREMVSAEPLWGHYPKNNNKPLKDFKQEGDLT